MEHTTTLFERLGDVLRLKAPPQAMERPASARRPERVHRRDRSRGLGVWWTFGIGLVLASAVIVAIVQNSQPVELQFLAWQLNVSLIVVVLTTALIAIALDEVGGLIWRRRRRSTLDRMKKLELLQAGRPPADEAPPASESPLLPAALGARASGRP